MSEFTLTPASTKVTPITAIPTLATQGITYGLRNYSLAIVMTGVAADWTGTITVYGLKNGLWINVADATVTVLAADAATVIYSPLHMIGYDRLYVKVSGVPTGAPTYFTMTDPRVG